MKSSTTVTNAEISSEPRQPRRFEKKKNMFQHAMMLHIQARIGTSVREACRVARC